MPTLAELLRDADTVWHQGSADRDRMARAAMADTSHIPVIGGAVRCACGGRMARPKLAGWFVCEACGERRE